MFTKKLLYVFLSLFIPVYFSGCTIIGFAAGAKSDFDKSLIDPPSIKKVGKIKNNTPVKIHLRNNMIIPGTFQGIESIDSSEYLKRYETFLAEQKYSRLFPTLTDTFTINRKSYFEEFVDRSKYQFLGFDLNSIRLRSLSDRNIKNIDLNAPDLVTNTHGKNINFETIKAYMNRGIIPLRSELIIQSAGEIQKLPGENVIKVEFKKSNVNRVLGALIGLSADILVLTTLHPKKKYPEQTHILFGK